MTRTAQSWLVVGPCRGPDHEAIRVARRLVELGCRAQTYDPALSRDPRWDLLDLLWEGAHQGVLLLQGDRLGADLLAELQRWHLRVAMVVSPKSAMRSDRWRWLLRACPLRGVTTERLESEARQAGIEDVVRWSPACWTAAGVEPAASSSGEVVVVSARSPAWSERRALAPLRRFGALILVAGTDVGPPESLESRLASAVLTVDLDHLQGEGGVIDLSLLVRGRPGLPGGSPSPPSWRAGLEETVAGRLTAGGGSVDPSAPTEDERQAGADRLVRWLTGG